MPLICSCKDSYATKVDFYGDANNTIMNWVGREDSSQSDFFKGDILEVLVLIDSCWHLRKVR